MYRNAVVLKWWLNRTQCWLQAAQPKSKYYPSPEPTCYQVNAPESGHPVAPAVYHIAHLVWHAHGTAKQHKEVAPHPIDGLLPQRTPSRACHSLNATSPPSLNTQVVWHLDWPALCDEHKDVSSVATPTANHSRLPVRYPGHGKSP